MKKKGMVLISFFLLVVFLFLTLNVVAETLTSSCRLINKSVNLSKNINASSTCLVINRSNIIVDCKGFEINYSQGSTIGYGVNNTGFNNVTIHNCTISQSETASSSFAIFLSSARFNNISHGNFTTQGTDAHALHFNGSTNNSQVTSTTIRTTGTTSVVLNGSNNNRLRDVTVSAGNNAVHLHLSNNNNISFSNLTLLNASTHVNVEMSNGTRIDNSNLSSISNSSIGVDVYSNSTASLLVNNTIHLLSNDGIGVRLFTVTQHNVTGNNIIAKGDSVRGINSTLSNQTVFAFNNFTLNGTNALGTHFSSAGLSNFSHNNLTFLGSNAQGTELEFNSNKVNITNNIFVLKGFSLAGGLTANAIFINRTNTTNILNNNFTLNRNNSKGVFIAGDSSFHTIHQNIFVVVGNASRAVEIKESNSNNITFNNFTVESTNSPNAGAGHTILVKPGNGTNIIGNNISTNGSSLSSVLVHSSYNANVSFNNISFYGNGIENAETPSAINLDGTNKSHVMHNNITFNSPADSPPAIRVNSANLTKIMYNTVNITGLATYGIATSDFSHHTNMSFNTVYVTGSDSVGLKTKNGVNVTMQENVVESYASSSDGTGAGILFGTGFISGRAWYNNITLYNNSASGILTIGASFSNISNNFITTRGNTSYGIRIGFNGLGSIDANNTLFDNNITTTGLNASGVLLDTGAGVGNNTVLNNTITSSNGFTLEDLTGSDYTNSIQYNNSKAFINWSKTNLTTNISLIIRGTGKTVFFENKHVGLANGSFPMQLNGSARISMYQTGITERPELLKNGVRCDDTATCNMSYNEDDKLLHANVSGFSSYVAALSPRPFVEKNTGGGGSSSSSTPTATATPTTPSTVSTTTSSIAVSKGTPSVISVKGKSYPVSVVTAASQRSATVQVGTQTISLAVGEKSEVDVDKDGKADMVVKVVAVSQSKAIMETTLIESSTSETTQAVSGNKGRRGFTPKTNEQSSGASVQGGHSVTQQTEKTTATPQAVLKDMLKTSSPGTIIAVIILGALAGLYTISGKNTPQELKKLARTTQQHTKKILRKIQKKL